MPEDCRRWSRSRPPADVPARLPARGSIRCSAQRNSMATFSPSTYPVSFSPRRNAPSRLVISSGALLSRKPITWHRRLLRACRERPGRRRTAEQRYECAPLHWTTSSRGLPSGGAGDITPCIRPRPLVPSLNFLDNVVGTSGRGRIRLGGEARDRLICGHETALVARTCSPAKLLGSLKFVGAHRCNDARRCHPRGWYSQGALAAMTSGG